MELKSLWLILAISVLMAGCQYILTEPASTCEAPNKIVKDIYGNDVCVTPEVEELPGTDDFNGTTDQNETAVSEEEPSEIMPDESVDERTDETPVDSDVPRKVVMEGDTVSFPNLRATDPDGDTITYTFGSPLDENGEWETSVGEAGEYLTTITASDGVNEVRQEVLIVVLSANRAPVITGIESRITVEEGDTITLDPVVTDPEGDDVTVTYSGWMDSPTYKTNYADAGSYSVTITATDGSARTSKRVEIIVEDVNRPPVIDQLDDLEAEVGEVISVIPTARDPDGDEVTFIFSAPLDQNGQWTPQTDDSGEYVVTVTATDGEGSDITTFNLVVGTPNRPPIFEDLSDITVNEGETVIIVPEAEDPEGEQVTFRYSGWMTTSIYQTTYEDAGSYRVTVTASDGENEVGQTITVDVNDVNRAPVFDRTAFE